MKDEQPSSFVVESPTGERYHLSEKVAAVVLGKKNMKNEHGMFEAIFVGLDERSEMVNVMDPRNEAQGVATGKCRKVQGKDGDMDMALRGLPWRPEPDTPALDEVPVRVSAESKVPWQDLPDAPEPRAPEVESVCTSTRRWNYGSMSTLKVAPVSQPRQDRRRGPQQWSSTANRRKDGGRK